LGGIIDKVVIDEVVIDDVDDVVLPSNILLARFNMCGLVATKYASSVTEIFFNASKLGLHKCKI